MKNYYLYWIKAEHHQDPFTEGYIGCSCQPKARFRNHTTDNTNTGSRAIKQYVLENGIDSVSMEILAEFSSEKEAKEKEREYRPHHHIGWNFQKGGLHNPDCAGFKHSEESKKKRSISVKKTKAQRSYISPFKGKPRWSDEQKAKIGAYHKGKTISQEHIESMRKKLSGSNSVWAKQTAIKDLNTGQIYIFGSLIEAAKGMNIGHSALKSAKRRYLLNGALVTIQKRYQLVPSQGKD